MLSMMWAHLSTSKKQLKGRVAITVFLMCFSHTFFRNFQSGKVGTYVDCVAAL